MRIVRTADGFAEVRGNDYFQLVGVNDLFDIPPNVETKSIAPPSQWRVPVDPSKVICVGLNYRAHAEEMSKKVPEEPLIFMKPPTALLPHRGTVELPPQSDEVHHEGELAIVVGKIAKKISVADVADVIFGYTIANDVTARDIQRREMRYTRAKGFDTFCPVGPVVVTADSFNPSESRIELRVNGEPRQSSSLDDFIFDIPTVVSFISHVMTLYPGDLILTGTPSGVGPMRAGDHVEIEIGGIGVLSHAVV